MIRRWDVNGMFMVYGVLKEELAASSQARVPSTHIMVAGRLMAGPDGPIYRLSTPANMGQWIGTSIDKASVGQVVVDRQWQL